MSLTGRQLDQKLTDRVLSGGLKPSGGSSSGCSSSTGQVYSRAATYEEYFAIMYSWCVPSDPVYGIVLLTDHVYRYMPKDEPSTGIGHRHDWEEAIAWLSAESEDATLVAFSVSGHGGISSSSSPGLSGDNPLAGYESFWPLDHQLIQTTTVGGTQPLIAWENLTTAAQDALQNTDFGDAIVPFKDSTFTSNLAKGYASL